MIFQMKNTTTLVLYLLQLCSLHVNSITEKKLTDEKLRILYDDFLERLANISLSVYQKTAIFADAVRN